MPDVSLLRAAGAGLGRFVVVLLLPLLPAVALGAPAVEEIRVEAPRSVADEFARIGAASRIDEQVIRATGAIHPAELLVRVPGVQVSRGSGEEHLTSIRSGVLTGTGACGAFLYLEDGLPIRPQGLCNVNNLFEVQSESAAAVEVVRGPGSAVFGGNAQYGAINVVLPEPGGDIAAVGVEGGPWDTLTVDAAWGAEAGAHAWRADFVGTTTNGWRDATGYGEQKLTVAHRLEQGPWRTLTRLSASLLNQETGGFVIGAGSFGESGLRDSNPNPEAFRDAWAIRLTSHWERDLDGGRTLQLVPYLRRSEMRFLQHFLPGQPLEENGQVSTGLVARLAGSQAIGAHALDWTVGSQLEYARSDLLEDQQTATVGSAFLRATRPVGIHYDYEVDSRLGALWYDLAFTAGRLTLVQSLRAEWLGHDYDNLASDGNLREDGLPCGFGGCLYRRPADRGDIERNLAGRLGAEWRVSDALAVHASIGTGFRTPQTTELYRLQQGQQVADLDSERLRSAELGWRWRGDALHLDVTGYVQRNRNEILRDSAGFNVSDGRTRGHGIEAEVHWQASDRHALGGVVTWSEQRYDFDRLIGGGEVIIDGNDVDTAPRWQGSAYWRWQALERVQLETEVVGLGRHFVNAANTAAYEGHFLLNLRASVAVTPEVTAWLRVMNVTDEHYADRADFAFGNLRYFPGEPARVFAGVRYAPGRG